MLRRESSVTSSLKQLMVEEEVRRAEQNALANRRKVAQEREQFENQTLLAEQRQRKAEAAERAITLQAEERRSEHERMERERSMELERVRSELELRARVTLMQTEQQHELERMALLRDRRLAKLEGQRLLLTGLSTTIIVGMGLLYAMVSRPNLQRQEQLVAELDRAASGERAEHEHERSRLEARILEQDHSLQRLQSALDLARQTRADVQLKGPPRVRTPTAAPPTAKIADNCSNANDPLCGNLLSK